MDFETNRRVELVLSAPFPTRAEIERLCLRARENRCRSIVVPSGGITLAHHFLSDEDIKISCRIGCASGSMDSDAKRYEAELAVDAGAHEIELVPSLARIEDGDLKFILREIRDVVEAADERPVKVAIEPSSWSASIMEQLAPILLDSGAQYICGSQKTVTTAHEIEQLRNLFGANFGIVARVERIDDAADALQAGANLVAVRA